MKLRFQDFDNIYLIAGATDLTMSYAGLSSIVSHNLCLDPTANNLYIFCNKSRRTIKMLEFDRNGFVIHSKKLLTREHFYWPKSSEDLETVIFDRRQLEWLPDGLNIYQKGAFSNINTVV